MKKTLLVLAGLAVLMAFTPSPAHARVVVGIGVGPVAVGPVVVGGPVYGGPAYGPGYVYGRPWGYGPYPYAYAPRYYGRPYWGPRVYAYGPRYYGPRYYGPRSYGYRR
ncbi:MAG: hypothetical protein ABSE92_06080 [Terriglobales bacterium]|jgi:hypothetical protein